MRKSYILALALLVLCFTSCTTKKYYYKQNDKEEVLIKASSDSDAYKQAYQKFVIAQKVHVDMKKTFGGSSLEAPIDFELLNDKHVDITNAVDFVTKYEYQKETEERINGLPNTVRQAVDRNIEEKNGVDAKYDTAGLYLAPVKVLSAKFVTKEYSNYKDISLHYKNVSGKKISAIRFKWYGENAFNEPADMGVLSNGWGSGFTDDGLRAGASDYGTWGILSKDGKKILIAYPYEVAFEDGSKWAL